MKADNTGRRPDTHRPLARPNRSAAVDEDADDRSLVSGLRFPSNGGSPCHHFVHAAAGTARPIGNCGFSIFRVTQSLTTSEMPRPNDEADG